MRLLSINLVFLALLALSGCGQKGPLYLPDQAPGQESEQEQR